MSDNVTYEGRDLEVLADMPRYYAWIMECFRPHLRGRVAEIGAGAGTVSGRLLPYVEALELIEPSGNLIKILRSKFDDDPRVKIIPETLENFLASAEPAAYDAIVMVNVLEHIEDDVAALRGLMARLKPGGKLLIFVPALPFLYSPLDRAAGHFRRYTRPVLVGVIKAAGFHILASRYMDLLGIIPWLLINKICRKTSFAPGTVWLYDVLGIPVTRFVEGLLGAPIGKNLIAVAEKPAQ